MATRTGPAGDYISSVAGSPTYSSDRPQSPPPHLRSSSRQSSTSSVHSIKRKPVPTELDQLRQLGTELISGRAASDAPESEEVLHDDARPNLLPHANRFAQTSPASPASPTYPPPAQSTTSLSRHASTSSRPLSPPNLPLVTPTTYSIRIAPSTSSAASSHASQSVFGSPPQGVIGETVPREIIRIERDYSSGTGTVQFWPGWIWELEGRVSPTVYQTVLNDLNDILASAHDPRKSVFDNVLAVLTLWISPMVLSSHYLKEMKRFDECLQRVNREHLNPVGLNLLNPEKNAQLFLELEYY